ncbi:MAG: sugar-binding domain-containing protein [Pirellulales bacterium]
MVRTDWVNLNGLWDYAIRPKGENKPQQQWDSTILVPFAIESALSGVQKPVTPEQQLWYRRKFEAPALPEKGRLLLHFGAVDWQCTVWVNGREFGRHEGGYDPFTFDITDALIEKENELVVSVWDPTDSGSQPKGKQVLKPEGIWYTAVTGIWQTVWLEPVPHHYIRSLKVGSDINRGVVTVSVDASGGDAVRLSSGDAESPSEGPVGNTVEIAIANPKLWSPDSPHLYDLKVELIAGGRVVDAVDSYAGMRKIEVRKDAEGINRLMLNDKVLFQYGPLDQGWWPDGLYTPATDEAMKYDIVMTKKFGMNMARKHVKYECDRWYYWCDKLGLLVWQDMPSGSAGRDNGSKKNYRKELKAMVDALRNHPCIVMWVPFNEGWGQHDTREVVSWLKDYDPSRLVNEASGWHNRGSGLVSDMHNYPGPGMRPVEERRAVVLGEFGGLGMPVRGHTWQDEKNWGYVSYDTHEKLTDAYVNLLTQMRPLIGQGLSAAVYTQTSDVEIEVNGLMTYDREHVKMDLERVATAARRLYDTAPKVTDLVPTSELQPQAWRYTNVQPQAGWMNEDFDDSSWPAGNGGFGKIGTPGAAVGTDWSTSDIWLRRTFDLETRPNGSQLALRIHHDEDVDVYLNGRQISRARGFATSYKLVPLDHEAMTALNVGQNTLAVYCRQTKGGQFVDVGLVLIEERTEGQAARAGDVVTQPARVAIGQ